MRALSLKLMPHNAPERLAFFALVATVATLRRNSISWLAFSDYF